MEYWNQNFDAESPSKPLLFNVVQHISMCFVDHQARCIYVCPFHSTNSRQPGKYLLLVRSILLGFINSQPGLCVKHVLIFTGNIHKRLKFVGIL